VPTKNHVIFYDSLSYFILANIPRVVLQKKWLIFKVSAQFVFADCVTSCNTENGNAIKISSKTYTSGKVRSSYKESNSSKTVLFLLVCKKDKIALESSEVKELRILKCKDAYMLYYYCFIKCSLVLRFLETQKCYYAAKWGAGGTNVCDT